MKATKLQMTTMKLFRQANELTRNITQSLPKGWMVSVADFAENYRCINQDEIQSAYYNYQQATLLRLFHITDVHPVKKVQYRNQLFL